MSHHRTSHVRRPFLSAAWNPSRFSGQTNHTVPHTNVNIYTARTTLNQHYFSSFAFANFSRSESANYTTNVNTKKKIRTELLVCERRPVSSSLFSFLSHTSLSLFVCQFFVFWLCVRTVPFDWNAIVLLKWMADGGQTCDEENILATRSPMLVFIECIHKFAKQRHDRNVWKEADVLRARYRFGLLRRSCRTLAHAHTHTLTAEMVHAQFVLPTINSVLSIQTGCECRCRTDIGT